MHHLSLVACFFPLILAQEPVLVSRTGNRKMMMKQTEKTKVRIAPFLSNKLVQTVTLTLIECTLIYVVLRWIGLIGDLFIRALKVRVKI